jgi:hypothetical protein
MFDLSAIDHVFFARPEDAREDSAERDNESGQRKHPALLSSGRTARVSRAKAATAGPLAFTFVTQLSRFQTECGLFERHRL